MSCANTQKHHIKSIYLITGGSNAEKYLNAKTLTDDLKSTVNT